MSFIYLIIGLGSMIVSIYYSFKWFIQRGMPVWLSWIISIIYVLAINAIFEQGIEKIRRSSLYKRKMLGISSKATSYEKLSYLSKRLLVAGILTMISWGMLSFYSMICTVGGQYDQLIIKEVQVEEKVLIDNSNIIKLKEEELYSLKIEQQALLKRITDIDTMEERYEYLNTTETTENRLDEINKLIFELSSELEQLYYEKEQYEYKEQFDVSNRNFFVYLSEIVNGKWDPVDIQFYLALFPAVVFDIVSPIFLTLFLISINKKDRQ